MSLSKHFKTVKELEKTGLPVEYGENSKGKMIRFFIARSGGANLEYLKYLEALLKPKRRLLDNGTLENKDIEPIVKQAFIEKALKGWENVEAEWEPQIEMEIGGETKLVHPDLEFSKKNAEKLYEEMPDLFMDHQQLSNKNTMFLEDVRKAESKNS